MIRIRSMFRWFLVVLATFFLTTLAAWNHAGEKGRILVMGDSISAGYGIDPAEGWVSLLSARLAEGAGWSVINASISGETTTGGRARLSGALSRNEPDIVIIELGGNDGLQGYPIDAIRENLRHMISMSRTAGVEVMLMEMRIPPNYGQRYTGSFQALFGELAASEGVTLIPFFLHNVATVPGLMQRDGIHPTSAAQAIMLENAWPFIREML